MGAHESRLESDQRGTAAPLRLATDGARASSWDIAISRGLYHDLVSADHRVLAAPPAAAVAVPVAPAPASPATAAPSAARADAGDISGGGSASGGGGGGSAPAPAAPATAAPSVAAAARAAADEARARADAAVAAEEKELADLLRSLDAVEKRSG